MTKSVGVQIGHYPNRGAAGEVPTCLMVVPKIEERLKAAGVLVTHYDEGLWHEPANMQHAHDVAVFIHCDSGNEKSTGFSLGYWDEKHSGSSRLAAVIREYYGKATGLKFIGYNISQNEAHYYGNNRFIPNCKCVLVELGFVSNPIERTFLQHNAEMVGYAVADGILKYLGVKPVEQEVFEMGFAVYQSVSKIRDWSTSVYLNGDMAEAWVDIINEGVEPVDVEVEIQLAKNGDIGTKTVPVKINDGNGSSNIATFSVGELFGNKTAGTCRLTFRPSKPTMTYKISQTKV